MSLCKNLYKGIFLAFCISFLGTTTAVAQRYDGVSMKGTRAKKDKGSRDRAEGEWMAGIGIVYTRGLNLDKRMVVPFGQDNDYLNLFVNAKIFVRYNWPKWSIQAYGLRQELGSGPAYNDRMNNFEGSYLETYGGGLSLHYSWYDDGSIRAYSGISGGMSSALEYQAPGSVYNVVGSRNLMLYDYSVTLLGLHTTIKNNFRFYGELEYGTMGLLSAGVCYIF
jgi:hypothetical protein